MEKSIEYLNLIVVVFCLNNLVKGGVICHVAWKWNYLENEFAEQAIRYDVENRTTGIYTL
jgi:hypothetical protein